MINSNMDEKLRQIVERYGQEYLLRQLAEECVELAQAALKLIRATRREGTPVEQEQALVSVMQEMADVSLMEDTVQAVLMTPEEIAAIFLEVKSKRARMYERLLGGGRNA